MSEVFDISQHIRVETLGARIGRRTDNNKIVVDGVEYLEDDYTIYENTPTEGVQLFEPGKPTPKVSVIVNVAAQTATVFFPESIKCNISVGGANVRTTSSPAVSSVTFSIGSTSKRVIVEAYKLNVATALVFDATVSIASGGNYSTTWPFNGNTYLGGDPVYPTFGITRKLNGTYDLTFKGLSFATNFVSPGAATRYLIGVSGEGEIYPQYFVDKPAYTLPNNAEREYTVNLPELDPNGAKITIVAVKDDLSSETINTLYTDPIAPTHPGTASAQSLTQAHPTTVINASDPLRFTWEQQYLNQKKGNCAWNRHPDSYWTDLRNTFGTAVVGYQIYHENRATNTFTTEDDIKATGTIAKTVFTQNTYSSPYSVPSQTATSTVVDDAYLGTGYNMFSIYPLYYSDFTMDTTVDIDDSMDYWYGFTLSEKFNASAYVDPETYHIILTLTFTNFPGTEFQQLRAFGQAINLVPPTGEISNTDLPANGTYTIDLGLYPKDLTDSMVDVSVSAVWEGPVANGGGTRQLASISFHPVISYEVGADEIGRKLVTGYNETVTAGLNNISGNDYNYTLISTATDTYYITLNDAENYPTYKFTVNGAGVARVVIPTLPTDFVLRVFKGSTLVNSYVIGDPYQYVYAPTVTAYGWWPIQKSTTRCDITQGYDIDKGMLYKPEVGTCNLELKGDGADPRVNTAIQLDNKVRVILDAAASPDNEDDYLFAGFIEDISTTYDTFGNAITQLGCVDAISRVMNVIIPTYEISAAESFSVRMNRVFEDYILPKTWGVSVDDTLWPAIDQYDGSVFPPELRDNLQSSEIINELTEGEAGVMVQNRGGVIFFYNRALAALILQANYDTLVNSAEHIGFSTVHHSSSVDHFCISDFTIQNSINDITNYVTATLTYDDQTELTASDAASIAKYGERAYAVSLNLHAPAGNITQYLQSWIDEVPYFETQSELSSVTTNVVNRAGKVTRAYQKDATLQPIRVYIDKGSVNVNGVWFAKQVKHSITPESWVMELDLTSD